MWKNKHVILAMIIAPMLAIIAWFAVDYFVAERPQSIQEGASYPLVAKPSCRRPSEACELKNEDVELRLSVPRYDADGAELVVESTVPLQRAAAGVAANVAPALLDRMSDDGTRWHGRIEGTIGATTQLRVAVIADGATFYAEVPVTFFFGGS